MKIIESYPCKNKYVLTPIGNVKILSVHKTIKYKIYRIQTTSGLILEASSKHTLITPEGEEIYVKDCLGKVVQTINGPEKVLKREFIKIDHCYDLTLENYHLYYSSGILSHNSGKSVVTGTWMSWVFTFETDVNIGIVANKGAMAREFLDKCKSMITNLPIWIKPGVVVWNKGSIKSESNTSILTDVPGDSAFRGWTINYLVVDETDWVDPKSFKALCDSVLPAQAALSKRKTIFLTTPNGKQQFYNLWKDAGYTAEESKNNYIRFDLDWKEVPRLKPDGTLWDPEEFKKYTMAREGETAWYQNYQCSFIGSSQTLIPNEILETYEIKTPIETDLKSQIKIYEEPIPGHKYVIGVDSAKEGQDFSSFQIFDMTDLNFRQVCSAKLKINYVMIPEILDTYGKKYNTALIIIENNEGSGQSIADILVRDYEYDNVFYEYRKSKGVTKRVVYPGFRTTRLSRELMLQTIRMLAVNNRLSLCDKQTIDEFETFILQDGKYEARGVNAHDDMVMATLISFSIFNNIKNIEDFRPIVDALKSESEISDDIINIGNFGLDSGYEDDEFHSEVRRLRNQDSESDEIFGIF